MKKDRKNRRSKPKRTMFQKFLDIKPAEYTPSAIWNRVKKLGVEMAQAKNYTEEMVNDMTTQYTANPTRETVDALAEQFGKTTRSIIAKLSREGVYVAQPRTTKSGEPVISKSELVAQISEHFGIEMPTLVKAGKQDLQKLVDAISQ
jgi:lipid II:glycine glycyltransferase (peptidoglycan interpeptide bridge formation enzyme)